MNKVAKQRTTLHDLLSLTLLAPSVALAKILWRPGASYEGWSISRIEHHKLASISSDEPAWIINIRQAAYPQLVYTILVTGGDIVRWLDKEKEKNGRKH